MVLYASRTVFMALHVSGIYNHFYSQKLSLIVRHTLGVAASLYESKSIQADTSQSKSGQVDPSRSKSIDVDASQRKLLHGDRGRLPFQNVFNLSIELFGRAIGGA